MVYLQKLHEKYAGRGLVVLGVDTADKRQIALNLIEKHGLTFPCIIDSTTKAQTLMRDYHISAAPTTYLIDREGKVAAAWIGFSEDDENIKAALNKCGLE